jgi:hypothetical protein
MLDFGNTTYYFDLDALDRVVTIKNGKDQIYTENEKKTVSTYPTTLPNGEIVVTKTVEEYQRNVPQIKEIDAIKYDMLKYFIEVVIETATEGDDALGAERALNNMPLGYKMAFNTLFKHGIIKEGEI